MINNSFLKNILSSRNFTINFPLNYVIPVYHCVSDEYLPHLKHVIDYKNENDFEKDLDFLASKFTFVDWDFFKNNYRKKHKKPIALLTFDDGLIEFKDVVVPILKRKGIFAINFVNPAFVGTNEMMFRFQASILIDSIKKNSGEIPNSLFKILNSEEKSTEDLIKTIKGITYQNKDVLQKLAQELAIDFEDYIEKNKIYMNLADLKSVQSDGFGIAAHSWDHPKFQNLSVHLQLENAVKSIHFMQENNFIEDCFAFPFTDFGVSAEFFERLQQENADFKLSFGTAGLKIDSISQNLQRIPMENNTSAKSEINFETNYFFLKKFFNKNILKRA